MATMKGRLSRRDSARRDLMMSGVMGFVSMHETVWCACQS